MKESLSNRVGRIVSGGFNALVDAVENAVPETVMEEAIREVDTAIDEVRADLGKTSAQKHLASKRLMEENRRHEDLVEKIQLAVNEGRDDLAEAAIGEQMDIEVQMPVLEGNIAECSEREKELEGYIAALQAKKREMKEELRQFRNSKQETASVGNADGEGESVSGSDVERKVSKAGSAFERVMENASGVPGKGRDFDRQSGAQLAELEELSRQNRIRERLESIKKS